MIDKPLYENLLAGGNKLQSQQTPNILKSFLPLQTYLVEQT